MPSFRLKFSALTKRLYFVLAGAAGILIGACDGPNPGSPATTTINDLVVTTDDAASPPIDARANRDRRRDSANQEPRMPKPDPAISPPARQSPAPPRREIQPSPIQPPAEIDPVRRDTGDEVPR